MKESKTFVRVAEVLPPDIYDERGGLYLSRGDLKRLEGLPAGTELFILETKKGRKKP